MEKLYKMNIDKLEITYRAEDTVREFLSKHDKVEYDGFWLERQESRKYEHEFAILCNDSDDTQGEFIRLIGYLYFGSFNINRQNVYISYTNEALYSWTINTRAFIEGSLCLTFLQISKLDVACDFNFNIQKQLIRVYKDLSYDVMICGEAMPNDEVKGVGVYSGNNPRKRLFAKPELIISNKHKTLTMRSYNKLREINQQSGKNYILETSGFKKIYRMEVSCKNHKVLLPSVQQIGMTEEELWGRITDEELLLNFFNITLNRIIRFRKNRKSYSIMELALKDM